MLTKVAVQQSTKLTDFVDILHVIEETIMGFSGLYECGHIFLQQTALNSAVWLQTQNVLCAIHLFINQAGLIGEFFWCFGLEIHLLLHQINHKGEYQGYFTDFGVYNSPLNPF